MTKAKKTTRDTEPTSHRWGGTDEPMVDEYEQHWRDRALKAEQTLAQVHVLLEQWNTLGRGDGIHGSQLRMILGEVQAPHKGKEEQ